MKRGIGLIFLLSIFCLQAKASIETKINLNIVNSFSGTIRIVENNTYQKNNIFYTSTGTPLIKIFSDSPSSYSITGDIINISGTQSQPYNIETRLYINKNNEINQIFPIFQKGTEPLMHEKINIFADTISPSIPNILFPQNNDKTNEPIIISWEESNDTGAGLKEYIILISDNASFATTLYYQRTTSNEQYIDTSLFPFGNLYIKILAQDEVANISESKTTNICNKCYTGIYDGGNHELSTFIPLPEKDIERITIIENLDETHQSAEKEDPNIGILGNILYGKELIDAYKYAYRLGITTQQTAYKADLKGPLVRKDLAKMISEYAMKVTKLKPNNKLLCDFDDLEKENLETKYYTKLSCKLGLMGRHADGKIKLTDFMPNEKVNRAQFGTVLSRTIFGGINNIQTGEKYERYQKHLIALNKNNIMNIINTPWMIELRGWVMLTMMRSDPNYNQSSSDL